MGVVSTSDVTYLAKVLYPRGYQAKDLYRKKALLNAIKKTTDFTSHRGKEIPLDGSLANGVGGTMAGAKNNSGAVQGLSYLIPQVSIFGYVSMDGVAFRNASNSNDDGAFIDYAKKAWADGVEVFMQEVARMAYGRRTGARAKVKTAATTIITLENPSDSLFFRKNMILVASATEGGALAGGTPGFSTILAVNPETGELTMDGTITTQITGITAGWSLYQQTLALNNGTGNGGWAGLGDYNPITPVASLFGVNQTLNPVQAAGVRTTDTSNLETLFVRAFAIWETQVGAEHSAGDIYLHPLQFAALVSTKEGQKDVASSSQVELGIERIKIGSYTFVKDPFAPLNYAHAVAEGALELSTSGKFPQVSNAWDDPDEDIVKIKLVADGNFLPRRPNGTMRSALPAAA